MRYQLPDISLQVPDPWQNRSIIAFAAPLEPGQSVAPNVVVTREQVAPGQDFRAYADAHIVFAKRLDEFKLISRQETQLRNLSAVALFFSWRGQTGTLAQWQIFFSGANGVVFNAVATATEADFPRYQQLFGQIFGSMEPSSAQPKY